MNHRNVIILLLLLHSSNVIVRSINVLKYVQDIGLLGRLAWLFDLLFSGMRSDELS
jgi:hypothetical protein